MIRRHDGARGAFLRAWRAAFGYDSRAMGEDGGVTPPGGEEPRRARLLELAQVFLKLGVIAFGGPAAHVAMMEDEVVVRRKWMTRDELLDLFGATALIPGPNSTELAIHIGHRRAGFLGLVVAGACFIVPAALITGALGYVYVRFESLPEMAAVLRGIKPVILAIVAQALWRLGKSAVRSHALAWIGIAALLAATLGLHELAVVGAGGAIAVIARTGRDRVPPRAPPPASPSSGGTALQLAIPAAGATLATSPGLGAIFLAFLKIGSVLFGSGYVLLAFLRADLVERWHWITEAQLLDAIAVGQVTPGPVFTTATFVGYLLAGPPGAAVATLGIFLPAFVFVAASGPLVPRIRRSSMAGSFLDGVNVASLALMGLVTIQLAGAALVDPLTIAIALASAIALIRWNVGSGWLVVAGAAIGVALQLLERA